VISLVIKVFISSRTCELSEERRIAAQVIREHKFEEDRWENWGAVASHTEDVCRKHVRESDIIVFILGKEFSPMVANEYDEAKENRKPCLIFVKEIESREEKLQNLLDNEMSKHVFYKKYGSLEDFKNSLDRSLSDLIEMKFRSEREKAIIHRAYKQCGIMNERILTARFVPQGQSFQKATLNHMQVRLFQEKMEIEKILREGL